MLDGSITEILGAVVEQCSYGLRVATPYRVGGGRVGFAGLGFDLAQNPVVFNWKCQKHYRHADKSNQTGELP